MNLILCLILITYFVPLFLNLCIMKFTKEASLLWMAFVPIYNIVMFTDNFTSIIFRLGELVQLKLSRLKNWLEQ